jgi:hypothetical protein
MVLLTDAQIKGFFTSPEKTPATLCTNIPYYDVLDQDGGVGTDILDPKDPNSGLKINAFKI